MSFQLFLQPFVSSGDYSGYKEMHEPGKWGWDVYGADVGTLAEADGAVEVDPDGSGAAAAFAFGNPDFNVRSPPGQRCTTMGSTGRAQPCIWYGSSSASAMSTTGAFGSRTTTTPSSAHNRRERLRPEDELLAG